MKSKTNMITGSPFKALLLFALPMILGNLFQQFYNIADSIIVGKFVGQSALAATGSSASIIQVFISIAMGLSTGCMVIFSQLYGAGHIGRMRSAMNTCTVFLGVLSIIVTAAGFVAAKVLLPGIVSEEIFEEARLYYEIYLLSVPALFIYNSASGIFNSLGKSKYILFLLGGTSVLNIVLDLWFVVGLDWGVMGAAIATDIAQYIVAIVGFFWSVVYLRKHHKTEEKITVFEFKLLGNMLKIAVPSMFAMLVVSVGYVILMGLVNEYDVNVISGYVAGYRLDSLCSIPMIQLGNAMATFAGQNVGAKQYDRVTKGVISGIIMCLVVWVAFMALVFTCGHGMIGLFMNESASEAAYQAGVGYMRVMASTYIILGIMYVFAATLRGTGDATFSLIGVICNFTTRCVFAAVVAGLVLGFVSGSEIWIWWSNPIGWTVAVVMSFIRFKNGKWKTKRLADRV